MAAPRNNVSFDFDVTSQAAENWHRRTSSRGEKLRELESGRYDKAEPKERLVKHANRLINKLKKAVPPGAEELPENLRELVKRGPIKEDEFDNILFERVIGSTRDFLSADFFERGI